MHFSLMTIEAIDWVKMTLLGLGEAVQGYEKHLQVASLVKKTRLDMRRGQGASSIKLYNTAKRSEISLGIG